MLKYTCWSDWKNGYAITSKECWTGVRRVSDVNVQPVFWSMSDKSGWKLNWASLNTNAEWAIWGELWHKLCSSLARFLGLAWTLKPSWEPWVQPELLVSIRKLWLKPSCHFSGTSHITQSNVEDSNQFLWLTLSSSCYIYRANTRQTASLCPLASMWL